MSDIKEEKTELSGSQRPEVWYKRAVQYYETDKMGIVHHSNYIRWFEEARTYYMEQRGFPYSRMETEGVMIPVLEVECRYKTPVRYGDTVMIHAVIESMSGTKMTVAYDIVNPETGKTAVIGSTSHCFVDAVTFRPVRLSKTHPEMAAIFTTVTDNETKGLTG